MIPLILAVPHPASTVGPCDSAAAGATASRQITLTASNNHLAFIFLYLLRVCAAWPDSFCSIAEIFIPVNGRKCLRRDIVTGR